MAVTYDATSIGSAASTTVTVSHTVAAGDNRLLVVQATEWNTDVTGATYNGVAMTAFGTKPIAPNDWEIGGWYLVAPATGTNNAVVTLGALNAEYGVCVTSLAGVDQSTPIDGFTATQGNSTGVSQNVASAAGHMVIDGLYSKTDPTVGAGQSANAELFIDASYYLSASREDGASTVTMSHTFTAGEFAHIAFNVRAAAASGVVRPARLTLLGTQ